MIAADQALPADLVAPRYGEASLSDVLPSLLAALGITAVFLVFQLGVLKEYQLDRFGAFLGQQDSAQRVAYERFDTSNAAFKAYLQKKTADTNAFYVVPAGGVDLCSAPVPVRKRPAK